ncbi:YbhB/YbcL family Raf kinase inhibitor-like protein [Chitinilyticum piscinae]|uniref:YbhB/YbcL family Raf kinase inhibitor-like protein n=1 Tax=Chitinilyticum piscinae TaxID=2866724 RepID=A0A8J7FNB2_9NEIS|nr:YbhB/YbcL family Raf kinase inhibitor-like protein [Chitinilyticum piscinae]MBE9609284.1 YbhB/YbcL family Raf kinase inhibitor-like protein [Chitinilyticum piscinae]
MSRTRLVTLSLLAGLLSGAALAGGFTLGSPTLQAGKPMPALHEFNGFGCKGDNQAPVLQWQGAPAGTRSFAVTVYDPDAPTGSGWWHWLVVNLPDNATQVDARALPAGALQTRTDYGSSGFGGACPPQGDAPHRYQFTVWALDTPTLPLDANASGALVGYMLRQHALGKAELTATYQRPRSE